MQLALFARRVDSKFSTGKFGKVEVTMEKCKGTFLYILSFYITVLFVIHRVSRYFSWYRKV